VAGYSIQGSYSTVQVITPTLTQPIQYTTIQTSPSGVIASIALDKADFDAGTASPLLTAFSNAIEQIMQRSEVIAGIGTQQIDENGLLTDYVTFTVQYVSANTASSGVTAEADVPVGMLNFTDGAIGALLLQEVDAIIAKAYNALQSAAGG
jgi:hypothetical protein